MICYVFYIFCSFINQWHKTLGILSIFEILQLARTKEPESSSSVSHWVLVVILAMLCGCCMHLADVCTTFTTHQDGFSWCTHVGYQNGEGAISLKLCCLIQHQPFPLVLLSCFSCLHLRLVHFPGGFPEK